MGTGSHRPQFEAAKGRRDELGGIKHARGLKSHTKLKYRTSLKPPTKPPSIQQIEHTKDKQDARGEEIMSVRTLDHSDSGHSDSGSEEDDSELESMQKELSLLKQREALRSQKQTKSKEAEAQQPSGWREESVFKAKKRKDTKKAFVHDFVR